jgi:tetratricopeptide (TPR) repeat protein
MDERTQGHILDPERDNELEELVDQGRQRYRVGELDAALLCLQQAYDGFKSDGNQSQIAEVANDLGVVYTVLRQWNQAEKWLNDAHRLFVGLGDYDGEAQTLGNLGSMYRARGKLQEAAAHLQLAADRFHLVDDNERRAMTLKSLGFVRLRQYRFLQALATFEAAYACQPNPTFIQRLLRKFLSLPLRVLQP